MDEAATIQATEIIIKCRKRIDSTGEIIEVSVSFLPDTLKLEDSIDDLLDKAFSALY